MIAASRVAAVLTLAAPLALGSCARTRPSPTRWDAIVSARHVGAEGDRVDGVPTYRTLGAALASAPKTATTESSARRYVIYLRNGRYHEKLSVEAPAVTIVGESRDSAVITYDAASGMPAPGGGTWGTRGSFTLRIVAPDFRAENLTIENAFDYDANARKRADDPTRVPNAQAVALYLDRGSDRAAFVHVRLLGHQDTLYANAGRSWFYQCEIVGHVDFIFGAGQAVFEDCIVVSLDLGSATQNGYVAAPSTTPDQPFGFLFLRSRLRKARPSMAAGSVALARPWHPSSNPDVRPAVAYVDSWMDDHVAPARWAGMGGTRAGAQVWYPPEGERFFERGSRGPGAAARDHWGSDARGYTREAVLRDWRPWEDAR